MEEKENVKENVNGKMQESVTLSESLKKRMDDAAENKEFFCRMLRKTGRDGVENVIAWLEGTDFFVAPASGQYHCNYIGGLVKHSINVYKMGMGILNMLKATCPERVEGITKEKIILCCLLHDVGKVGMYNRIFSKNEIGEKVCTGFGYNTEGRLPLSHAEKGLVMLQRCCIRLEDDEYTAIRYHMGLWEIDRDDHKMEDMYNQARKLYPLVTIIGEADTLAAMVVETKVRHQSRL